jgi:hypothetical protein
MDYIVVFDITKTQPDWHLPVFALCFVLAGAVTLTLTVVSRFWNIPFYKRPKTIVAFGFRLVYSLFFFGFAVYGATVTSWSTFQNYAIDRTAYEHGDFKVVEGPVENFHPMPVEGHDLESFTVKGQKFEYSDFVISPGFHNATSRGGPILEGLPVRISYVKNDIVKLEIKK